MKKYAKADIVWKDTGDFIDGVIFKLSTDVDPNEDGYYLYDDFMNRLQNSIDQYDILIDKYGIRPADIPSTGID